MTDPYDTLAVIYDAVMDHVDYDRWARYVKACLDTHAASVTSILELGGGTGSLAVRLQPMGAYDYVLTDGSAAMVRQARAKVASAGIDAIECTEASFTQVTLDDLGRDPPFDAVVLVYDGLNYLTSTDAVAACFERVAEVLRPGGIAVIDHATPANSEDHDVEFTDRGTAEGTSYVRHSVYDASDHLHRTTFELVHGGRRVREEHVQRTYRPRTIARLVHESPLQVRAAYDGFTLRPAHDRSHRVHWVLERPETVT